MDHLQPPDPVAWSLDRIQQVYWNSLFVSGLNCPGTCPVTIHSIADLDYFGPKFLCFLTFFLMRSLSLQSSRMRLTDSLTFEKFCEATVFEVFRLFMENIRFDVAFEFFCHNSHEFNGPVFHEKFD